MAIVFPGFFLLELYRLTLKNIYIKNLFRKLGYIVLLIAFLGGDFSSDEELLSEELLLDPEELFVDPDELSEDPEELLPEELVEDVALLAD